MAGFRKSNKDFYKKFGGKNTLKQETYKILASKFKAGKGRDKKIDKENAQGSDVSLYSEILGEHLSDALIKNITDDKLPEGKIYYNIAERIIMPMLEEVHKLVNISAVNVQKIEDKKGNIKIKPQQGAFPTERAKAIIQAIADTTEEMFDD